MLAIRENGTVNIRLTAQTLKATLTNSAAPDRQEFEASWRQFLAELKNYLDRLFPNDARIATEQAYLLESGVRVALGDEGSAYPSLRMSDRLFIEVFKNSGRQLINKKEAAVKADVAEYMADTGIESEQEARKKMAEEREGAMGGFVEVVKKDNHQD